MTGGNSTGLVLLAKKALLPRPSSIGKCLLAWKAGDSVKVAFTKCEDIEDRTKDDTPVTFTVNAVPKGLSVQTVKVHNHPGLLLIPPKDW